MRIPVFLIDLTGNKELSREFLNKEYKLEWRVKVQGHAVVGDYVARLNSKEKPEYTVFPRNYTGAGVVTLPEGVTKLVGPVWPIHLHRIPYAAEDPIVHVSKEEYEDLLSYRKQNGYVWLYVDYLTDPVIPGGMDIPERAMYKLPNFEDKAESAVQGCPEAREMSQQSAYIVRPSGATTITVPAGHSVVLKSSEAPAEGATVAQQKADGIDLNYIRTSGLQMEKERMASQIAALSTEATHLRIENRRVEADLETSKAENRELARRIEGLKAESKSYGDANNGLQYTIAELNRQMTSLEGRIVDANMQLTTERNRRGIYESEWLAMRDSRDTTAAELRRVEGALAKAEEDLKKANTDVGVLVADLHDRVDERDKALAEVELLKRKVTELELEHSKTIPLTLERDQLKRDLDAAKEKLRKGMTFEGFVETTLENAELRQKVDSLTKERDSLKEELKDIRERAEFYQKERTKFHEAYVENISLKGRLNIFQSEILELRQKVESMTKELAASKYGCGVYEFDIMNLRGELGRTKEALAKLEKEKYVLSGGVTGMAHDLQRANAANAVLQATLDSVTKQREELAQKVFLNHLPKVEVSPEMRLSIENRKLRQRVNELERTEKLYKAARERGMEFVTAQGVEPELRESVLAAHLGLALKDNDRLFKDLKRVRTAATSYRIALGKSNEILSALFSKTPTMRHESVRGISRSISALNDIEAIVHRGIAKGYTDADNVKP